MNLWILHQYGLAKLLQFTVIFVFCICKKQLKQVGKCTKFEKFQVRCGYNIFRKFLEKFRHRLIKKFSSLESQSQSQISCLEWLYGIFDEVSVSTFQPKSVWSRSFNQDLVSKFGARLHHRGEHGQDQDWISCKILAIFFGSGLDLDSYFWKKLDQDRIRIFVWFL